MTLEQLTVNDKQEAKMPRVLVIQTDDDKTFTLPVADKQGDSLVLSTDTNGFAKVKGTDGQQVVIHRSRIAWIHVRPLESI